MCLLGASDADLAEAFNVDQAQIARWRVDYPPFDKAINASREGADVRVVRSAFRRTQGYKVKERAKVTGPNGVQVIEKERYIPPSDAMITLWLTNRQGKRWRDRKVVEEGSHVDLVAIIKEAMKLEARQPGDDAKLVEARPVKDDGADDTP